MKIYKPIDFANLDGDTWANYGLEAAIAQRANELQPQIKERLVYEFAGNIRSVGLNIVWCNSNTVRYLRISIALWKKRYSFDFFRKHKI